MNIIQFCCREDDTAMLFPSFAWALFNAYTCGCLLCFYDMRHVDIYNDFMIGVFCENFVWRKRMYGYIY